MKKISLINGQNVEVIEVKYGDSLLAFKRMAKKLAKENRLWVDSANAYNAIIQDNNFVFNCYLGEATSRWAM